VPRYDAEWIQVMLRPELRGSPTPEEIIAAIAVRPGDIVADVGCGPGFLTIPAAVAVGSSGRVYAVDVEPSMLDVVRQRSAAVPIENVVTLGPGGTTLPLPDRTADVTLCSLVLHDLDDPEALMREIARITRSTGKVAIVEWIPEVENARQNRIPPAVVARYLTDIGFRAGDPIPLPPAQYLIVGTPAR
jgi:ubiquinone/menaquinone biosynthesis C-methylase UbiE